MIDEQEKIEWINYYLNNQVSIKEVGIKFKRGVKIISKYFKDSKIKIKDSNRLYNFNENYFENIDTEDKAYWLGFIFADGYVPTREDNTGKYLCISLASYDKGHLEKLNKCMNANCAIYHQKWGKNKQHDGVKWQVCSTKIVQDLTKYNIVPRKSLSQQPWMECPNYLLRHYLRGIWDGDGWVAKGKNNKNIEFAYYGVCGNIKTVTFFRDFINKKFNLFKDIRTNSRPDKDGNINNFAISYAGHKNIEILNYLYADSTMYLDRKYEVFCWAVNKANNFKLSKQS